MSETAGNRRTRSRCAVNVEAGKSYWWCACGRSKSQPFCDGSHKGTAVHAAANSRPETTERGLVLHLQAHRNAAAVRRQP